MKNRLLACMAGCFGMGTFSAGAAFNTGAARLVFIPMFVVCVGLAVSSAMLLLQEYDKESRP